MSVLYARLQDDFEYGFAQYDYCYDAVERSAGAVVAADVVVVVLVAAVVITMLLLLLLL